MNKIKEYAKYNDYELLYLINEDEDIESILYEKYKLLIMKLAIFFMNKFPDSGLEVDDLIQEGRIALNIAARKYDPDEDTTFFTFLYKCIFYSMSSCISKNTNGKNKILNESVSYNMSDKSFDDKLTNDTINNKYNPYNIVLDKNIDLIFIENLKGTEKNVAICKMIGFSNSEIAQILNVEIKSVYNTITRIKNKLKSWEI